MSNVEYRCPICRNRLFAPPGGTPHHCPNHPDTKYEQVEDYQGPNFEYNDSEHADPRKTGVMTTGVQNVVPVVKQVVVPEMTEQERLVYYREQYRRISGGERPDMRWGEKRLKEEIEAWEADHTPEPEATSEETSEGEPEDEVEPETEDQDDDQAD